MTPIIMILFLLCLSFEASALILRPKPSFAVTRLNSFSNVWGTSFPLADTSISEEEILSVTGSSSQLPDPVFAIVFAFVILAGIGILQFSLGDLTKEVRIYHLTLSDIFLKRHCHLYYLRRGRLEFVTFCKPKRIPNERGDILISTYK